MPFKAESGIELIDNSNSGCILGLLEERALLMGQMGLHEQALFIYVHVLKNIKMAEE